MCGFEVGQVVVVCVDNGLMNVANEVRVPGFKCMNNGKKFLVVDVPVPLGHIESLGKESNRVELAFLIPLLKDRSHHVGGSVTIHNEGVLKLRLSKYGGGAKGVF
jgi:hypothetical protein